MSWVTTDAPTRAELAACVQCGLCLPHCPTYRLTGDEVASPRGRLTAMAAVAEGIVAIDETFENAMGFCLQCRACEVVCPSLVPFGRAMEGARAEISVQLPTRSRTIRHVLVGRVLASRPLVATVTWLTALLQRLPVMGLVPPRLRRGFSGLRELPLRPRSTLGTVHEPIGPRIGTAMLLAGCVMDPWFGDVHTASIALLRRAGWRVVVPAGQTCCGALAAHDGNAEATRRLARRNVIAFGGADVIVADAAGCGAHLREYRHWAGAAGADFGDKVRDVNELVAAAIDEGRLPILPNDGGRVVIQDPCHLRNAQRITAEPRSVVRAAGKDTVEIDSMCCGAAGVYSLLYSDTSAALGTKKADEIHKAGVSVVASANPGCEMQLRGYLEDGCLVAHPVELYWDALQGFEAAPTEPAPTS